MRASFHPPVVSVEGEDVHHSTVHEAAGWGEAPEDNDDDNNDDDNDDDDSYLMMPRVAPDCCTWALTRYRPSEEHRDCGGKNQILGKTKFGKICIKSSNFYVYITEIRYFQEPTDQK